MGSFTKSSWLVLSGLIGLGIIPVIAGAFRLVQLTAGSESTLDDARFFLAPVPIMLHIVGSSIYLLLGAFQLTTAICRFSLKWHRISGRILILCGLVTAFSGLWMTLIYPSVNFDGTSVFTLRLLVGSAMAACLYLGVVSIRSRKFDCHQAWMIRSYALGLGAGTQVITHLPWFMFPSIQGELARALCMGTGWFINLIVAEWVIFRMNKG